MLADLVSAPISLGYDLLENNHILLFSKIEYESHYKMLPNHIPLLFYHMQPQELTTVKKDWLRVFDKHAHL